MDRAKFNPDEWINGGRPAIKTRKTNSKGEITYARIDALIGLLEKQRLDITSIYDDWRNIGFGLADEFGEKGRELFHRISQFWPNYTIKDCDENYNKYLKSQRKGIAIGSVFYLLKNAGITFQNQKNSVMNSNSTTPEDMQLPNSELSFEEESHETMPTFPDSCFHHIPEFLKDAVVYAPSKEERDVLLLGSIVCISACLPNIYGIYDNRKVMANLFLYVLAGASGGKGVLEHCRNLVGPIHNELRNEAKQLENQYEDELAAFLQQKGKKKRSEKPAKPPAKMLFIPANNSSTGAYQILDDNKGKGLIFETEGDTLAQAFKTDYGNYSDGFRKAFHHEVISYYRRTDREYVEIKKPGLSTLLSATYKQLPSLIPNAENGLFSRFMFYCMNMGFEWRDVFKKRCEQGLDEYFDSLGKRFYQLYDTLNNSKEIQFSLTKEQEDEFNATFKNTHEVYLLLKGPDYLASVRRLGLITFRICMIFSVLRILEHGEYEEKITCDDRDFQCAISLMKILIKHSVKVFSELPADVKPSKQLTLKERFLSGLPDQFNRQGYLIAAKTVGVHDKTAERYIAAFVKSGILHHDTHDLYLNLLNKEVEEIKEIKDLSPQNPQSP